MMRFLTNSTRLKKEGEGSGSEDVWEVWEVCDDHTTGDFLHIRRVATIPRDWLHLVSPETFQQQLLLGMEVKV